MEIVFKHFWVLFLVVFIYNAFAGRKKFERYIQDDPTLEEGYNKFVLWNSIIGSIPILLIGVGIVTGQLNDMFEIFDVNSEKWIIKLFYTYSICIWILGFWWVYFHDGAKFIEKHKGVYQINFFGKTINPNARQIKYYYPFTILAAFALYWWFSKIGLWKKS